LYLAAASAAIVALNLSSIYYMAYCAPFVVLFALVEGFRWERLGRGRVWLELWAAAAFVLVVTAPFLLPYVDVQRRLGVARGLEEVIRFSATLDHYRVALPSLTAALSLAAVAVVAGPINRRTRTLVMATAAFMLLAVWLSLGPVPHAAGQPMGWPGAYAWLHEHVPGYSGLRVPARFASIFFLYLAVLAGIGVSLLERLQPIVGRTIGAVAVSIFLIQAQPGAFPLNQPLLSPELVSPPPAYLTPSAALPPIYRAVDSLREGAILAEFPFGDPWYDLRYMFFSSLHRRRLLNGYSGIFPPSFLARQRVLARPLLDPEASAQALGGATHILVHRRAWSDDTGMKIGTWLEARGAAVIADADDAVLYALPMAERLVRRAKD
jgi:hypothetical protein